jgi:hypothetical protein
MGFQERLGLKNDEQGRVIIPVKFRGYDDWNRPVYYNKDLHSYFGSTCTLFPDKTIAPNGTVEEVNKYFKDNIAELEYFGTSFDCEPHGGLNPKYTLEIID